MITTASAIAAVSVEADRAGEDLFAWLDRVHGGFDAAKYRQVLGAANPFKEGDALQGLAAADDRSRESARRLLAHTTIGALLAHPIFQDEVVAFADACVEVDARRALEPWKMGQLVRFLLDRSEDEVKAVMRGLTSDVIACVVKLMSNDELIAMGRKVFNRLPGSNIGARGYLGARIQPNSPTDAPEDIVMQVFDGWSYAVGDVVLGTNPVSSDVDRVAAIELALQEVLAAFDLEQLVPHCVLAHIDVQAKVETRFPGSTALWFQSLGGVADANAVFGIDVGRMAAYAATRTGPFGMYFETGQGADATNGHGKGFDMVIHESRKYGFARALKAVIAEARVGAGHAAEPWVHVNDVAGFIGPEVFRTKEQLVRVCLEDTVMGKLHGLTIGLDICSTLHMDVSLDDLGWCIEQVMPANPAYLMALPTRNDPMLSYLTTAFQDHVHVRARFGYKVDDLMWTFFRRLGVIDDEGRPTEHFGDPAWVYLQYRRAAGDTRTDTEILEEAQARIARVRGRGVFIATGHGAQPWDVEPALDQQVRLLYEDAKRCIHAQLPATFPIMLAPAVAVETRSSDRHDYVLHPPTGEALAEASLVTLRELRDSRAGRCDVQIVVTDGLNAPALTDEGHLAPYLEELRRALVQHGFHPAPEIVIVSNGRVRAGYRIGETLFGGPSAPESAAVVNVIGERPGNGHHTFSVYVTRLRAHVWSHPGLVDHNHTAVISNVADTALHPVVAAQQTVALLMGNGHSNHS
ncbi:MAG TPA: ethanolamine ammonia-lyase subunit EutB [Vicinamibacterales bacterium]